MRHEHKWSSWVQPFNGSKFYRECVSRIRGRRCTVHEVKKLLPIQELIRKICKDDHTKGILVK